MTSPRYLIVDTSGDVYGTNDRDQLPNIETHLTICTIIDTLESTYSNEDVADADVADYEPETDSDEGDDE